MTTWTLDDLRRLDLKYAEEGVHVHQRPFRAATELLGSAFVMGVGGNPEVKQIMDAYAAMMPEVDTSWPGAGIGFTASVDQVRKLTFPVVFGQVSLQPWQVAAFPSAEEWWNWCRQDRSIAGEVALAVADLHDLTNGLNEVEHGNPAAVTLWRMARSNLEDVANIRCVLDTENDAAEISLDENVTREATVALLAGLCVLAYTLGADAAASEHQPARQIAEPHPLRLPHLDR